MEEIWKDIKGYEGLYQVSNLGRVKRIGKYKNQFNTEWESNKCLKMNKDRDGYCLVHLSKEGIVKCKKAHRLVAETFIENPENYEMINHKNEIKDDNRVENLEWCSHSENQKHALRTGLNVKPYAAGKYKKAVLQIDPITKDVVTEFNSITAATLYFGKTNTTNIGNVLNGRHKIAYGVEWKYK